MNYPERGDMSEDGKLYTHTDGSVYEFKDNGAHQGCNDCDCEYEGTTEACNHCFGGVFCLIEGLCVPSTEEREACDVMREGIRNCANAWLKETPCAACKLLADKTCALRVYLDKHNQPDAWETK